MIALDGNVLVRYLVEDHPQQAGAARRLMAKLTTERHGFICKEVSVEFVRILDRAYGFSRNRIATAFEELAATREINLAAADDQIRAAHGYPRAGSYLGEQVILAAVKRSSTDTLYTVDRQDGPLLATALLPPARA